MVHPIPRPLSSMPPSPQQIIAAQAREIEQLKAARNVPNTAAADMAGILNFSNTTLQSNKQDLEEKNSVLLQQIAAIAQRNVFLETELASASRLLRQTIPGEQDLKQQNKALQTANKKLEQEESLPEKQITTLQAKNKTLEADKLHLQQQNHGISLQQAKVLAENATLHNACGQWNLFSAQQGADLAFLRGNAQVLHESLVRKAWRLHIQKTYLDQAGLVVKEFEKIDDDVIAAWAMENMAKSKEAAEAGGKAGAGEVGVTPVVANFPTMDAKKVDADVTTKERASEDADAK